MKKASVAALSFLLCAAMPALAWDALPAQNDASLARSFALPALGQSSVLSPGKSSFSVNLDEINEYYADGTANESIMLDGETTKLLFGYRRGISDTLELTVDVPVYFVGGGFMDQIIQDWHHTFGLPNYGREQVPNNRRVYRYTRNGVTVLNESGNEQGFGDVQIGTGWQLANSLALRGMVKLPTGDKDKLTGGNLGGAVWADWALPFAQNSAFEGFITGGVSMNRRSDVLSNQQQLTVGFGGVGLGYHLTENLELLGQLYAHTALYKDSNLDGLKNPTLLTTVGASYQVAPNLKLNLYFQEDDPVKSTAPDFSVHIGLTVR